MVASTWSRTVTLSGSRSRVPWGGELSIFISQSSLGAKSSCCSMPRAEA